MVGEPAPPPGLDWLAGLPGCSFTPPRPLPTARAPLPGLSKQPVPPPWAQAGFLGGPLRPAPGPPRPSKILATPSVPFKVITPSLEPPANKRPRPWVLGPRVNHIVMHPVLPTLPTYSQLMQEKQLLEERCKKLEADKKKVDEEGLQLRELVEELVGVVECPVCLVLPTQEGPIPVCPNGHFVCRTCRDRLRQDAGADLVKCPSCTVDLGNATSLLASRLVEGVKHQCEHFGCEEMVEFAKLGTHLRVCQFRRVLCPGKGTTCTIILPFNKMEEHVLSCGNNQFRHLILPFENKSEVHYDIQTWLRPLQYWKTVIVEAHGKMFFCKMMRRKKMFFWEVVMLGSEEECNGYKVSLAILKNSFEVFKSTWCPRPIDQERIGGRGLYLSKKDLACSATEENFKFTTKISIDKI